jgi:hypothetical protein
MRASLPDYEASSGRCALGCALVVLGAYLLALNVRVEDGFLSCCRSPLPDGQF